MSPVVLVHGFLVGPWSMRWLGRRLEKAGFATHSFGFSSRQLSLREAADQLAIFCQRIHPSPCHLVCHSMGGLVALEMLHTEAIKEAIDPPSPPALVLLGTPVKGAQAAQGLGRTAWGQRLLGEAKMSLSQSFDHAPKGWSTTVIAGTRSVGLGRLFSPLPLPNDGTVALSETTLIGARFIKVHASHSGLLMSSEVAKHTVSSLQSLRPKP